MIKAILFDLDDTLFDHRHSMRMALTAIQNKYECFASSSLDEFEKQHIGFLNEVHFTQILKGEMTPDEGRIHRFKKAFEVYGINASDELAAKAAMFYRQYYLKAERLKPGAVELLTRLKKSYKTGIVTNNFVDEQVRKLKNGGIEALVDVMVTSEEIGVTKPDALIFQTALDRLSSTAADTVMIGDSWETDIIAAHSLGMKCIWVNSYNETRSCDGYAYEIKSLEDTEKILDLINN